ncbi:MAG: PHP domain-containing protein [Acutalibacteraceae bacterium]|nr:PHP domain-containing protein [Acutalibacteraceae bacterium]
MSADLHCHTKMSDGSVTIEELVILAKNKGITTISVTDHDTFAGSTRAKVFAKRHGVTVIPGIEFSAFDYDRNQKVHVLCYHCSYPDRLEGLCKRIGDSRKKAASIMVQKVMHLYPVGADILLRHSHGSTNVFKQHIMHGLMDAGYTNELYGSVYNKLFTPRIGLANAKIEYPDVHHVLSEVKQAGGIAVIAHPGQLKDISLLEQLADRKEIDGIEVWHPSNEESLVAQLMTLAETHHLLMTGGTDFHGMYSKVPRTIGSYITPQDQVRALEKWKQKHKS